MQLIFSILNLSIQITIDLIGFNSSPLEAKYKISIITISKSYNGVKVKGMKGNNLRKSGAIS